MKKTFIKFLPLMAAAMLATSCNNDDEIKKDGENTVSKPETTSIPFAIKVDTGKSPSKIGFADDGTKVNISFTEADVDNLKLQIYSNTKTVQGWNGEPTNAFYGELTLKSIDGVFKGTLDWIPSSAGTSPDDGEELLAIIHTVPTSPIYESTVSLADLMENTVHQYEGTFRFDGSTPISNEEEKNDPYYLPIPEFDDDHLPVVRLTDQMTFFEFYFPNLETIYLGKTMIYTDENSVQQELDHEMLYDPVTLNNHKFWLVASDDATFGRIMIRTEAVISEETLLYSKQKEAMTPGVIYSVTRPQKN